MMGERQSLQTSLFYEFSLEDHIPTDHLIRGIDRFVDRSDIRRHLAPFYSAMGRPSIDPELMIRMLLVGYCFGIRSERRLCQEFHLNLACRWFCRLDLSDPIRSRTTRPSPRTASLGDEGIACPLPDRALEMPEKGAAYGCFRDSDLFRVCSRPCSPAASPRDWSAARPSASTRP